MLNTAPLQDAFCALLDAATTMADADGSGPAPPNGEWNADQILGHVCLVSAATIAVLAGVAAGANTTYDNRIALDAWTIEQSIAHAGGNAGLRDPISAQAAALCALAKRCGAQRRRTRHPGTRPALSNDTLLVDQPVPAARHRYGTGGGGTARPHETARPKDVHGTRRW
ncbi:hypothetical protein AB0L66_30190 [Streptomyces sp. NPDC052207]|uniref:hypothetical protein n=1 Tax=Streptomyces sp. NPDC052207 TaxID=3155418 RepID=UPI0034234A5E